MQIGFLVVDGLVVHEKGQTVNATPLFSEYLKHSERWGVQISKQENEMTTLQVDKFTSGNQPQITDSKIYTGAPIAPYAGGARHTRQPPITGYKIYSSKPLPTVSVRFKDSASGEETFTINESDFDDDIHVLVDP